MTSRWRSTSQMKIAIHQPNFVPWLPFFKKMMAVDKFVILGHCQFEKGGYQNRFHYADKWWTMSVEKGLFQIVDKTYVNHEEDWQSIVQGIGHVLTEEMTPLISNSLWQTNVGIIRFLARKLGIATPIVFDSPTPLRSTDRLIYICQQNKADTYVAGPSGTQYMDLAQFKAARIKVEILEVQDKDKKHVFDLL